MRGSHISSCLLSACCSSNSADYSFPSPLWSMLTTPWFPLTPLLSVLPPLTISSLFFGIFSLLSSQLSLLCFLLPDFSSLFFDFSGLCCLSFPLSSLSARLFTLSSVLSPLYFLSTLVFPCCFLLSPLYFFPLCSLLFPLSSLFFLFAVSFLSPLCYLLSFSLLSPLCSLLSLLLCTPSLAFKGHKQKSCLTSKATHNTHKHIQIHTFTHIYTS